MRSTCGKEEVLPLRNVPIIGSLLLENFGNCNQLENSFPSHQSRFAAASVEVFYRAVGAPITPTSGSETGPSLCFISSTRLGDFLDWLISCRSSSSAFSAELPDTSTRLNVNVPLFSSQTAGPLSGPWPWLFNTIAALFWLNIPVSANPLPLLRWPVAGVFR